jgi:hypothetical protein
VTQFSFPFSRVMRVDPLESEAGAAVVADIVFDV